MTVDRPKRLGKYDLVARIAKGGMAEIYLARQHGMVGFSRLVVVKRILAHLAEETEFVRMFMEEARLAALINHPNVVQIYDVGQYEGHYFIAMEYINGLSLGIIARRARELGRPVPHGIAAEIVAQACDGLHAAHELKDEEGRQLELVHRDVSPHNLMISRDGLVKLVDFGIAKAQDTAVKTHTGKIKGKYPYMSPEQCRGDPLDRRTDIFSLAVVFFELLTGRRLFHRSTDLMVLKAITEEPIPDPREMHAEIPEAIVKVVLQALARRPDQRFDSAAQMGKAIRGALRELGAQMSQEHLAHHLQTEYNDLLSARADAIEQALQLRITGVTPPHLAGFEEERSRSSSTAGETPRGKRRTLATAAVGSPFPTRRVMLVAVGAVLLAGGSGLLYRHLTRPSRPAGTPLRFGLPPSFPAKVAEREMGPFLRYLERQLVRPVDLVVTRDYAKLTKMLLVGEVDFANMPPLQFVLARHQNPKLEVVVTQTYEKARRYQAYLVVRDDSPINAVADLRGKRFCYVDRGSASGYLLPRYFLRKKGVDPDKDFAATRFSGTHVAVLKDIVAGRCDVGGIYSGAMLSAHTLGVAASRLRMLAVAAQIPYDVICASPRLPPKLVQSLRRALLQMEPQRDLGRKIVGPTFRIDGFVEPSLDEFAHVEQAARAEGMLR